METSASEPLMTYRNFILDDVKTKGGLSPWDQSGGNLRPGQAASGIKAASTCIRLL
jgi:hypothetical protein